MDALRAAAARALDGGLEVPAVVAQLERVSRASA
jgi:hypothetical protein